MLVHVDFLGGGISKAGKPYCMLYTLTPVKNGYGVFPSQIYYEGSLSGVEFPCDLDIEFGPRGSVQSVNFPSSIKSDSSSGASSGASVKDKK